MKKHYSLVHAEKILKALRKAMPKDISKQISIECWANCREQGFHLENNKNSKALVFAQQRNSDSILVVAGEDRDFDITTNMPSDEIWKSNNKCFDVDKPEETVSHIIKHLVG